MSLLKNLKNKLHHWYLQKEIRDKNFRRHSTNMEDARSVGILFNASDPTWKQAALDYAEKLKKSGKKVELLAYLHAKQRDESLSFSHFCKKDLDFSRRPASQEVKDFQQRRFDLLINLSSAPVQSLEYIASLSGAAFRVGPTTSNFQCYDLMIDTGRKSDPAFFIHQVEFFLNKMSPKNEPATA